ncbi:MAG TPA: hypothetical protein VF316_14085 [Polyangiaceae bacterium]
MWLQATFTTADLAHAFERICPAHVRIDEDRWIDIARPTTLELIDGIGVRLITEARIRWTVIGIDVPITVKEAEIFLVPRLVEVDGHTVLELTPRLGDFDLKFVPHLVDEGIATRINEALVNERGAMQLDFAKMLDWMVPLPKALAPADSVHLQAKWAEFRIADDAITFAVSFGADVSRNREIRAA